MGKSKKKVKNVKGNLSIKYTLLGMGLIPLIVLSLIITIAASTKMEKSMKEEAMEGLKQTCITLGAGIDKISPLDMTYLGDVLKKGSTPLSSKGVLNPFVEGTDCEVTIFYGDTRRATTINDSATGEPLVGTKASDIVIDTVLNKGQHYQAEDVVINGNKYYAYYTPLFSNDGSVIGMYFAGKPSAAVEKEIRSAVLMIVVIAVIVTLLSALLILFVANQLAASIVKTKNSIEELASGDLSVSVQPEILARADELGQMGNAVQNLADSLREIIGSIQASAKNVLDLGNNLEEMATQTSQTADDISAAVEDISKGAVSQAEEIETATGRVSEMGVLIEDIVNNIDNLNDTSAKMQRAGEESSNIMEQLSVSNDRTFQAINTVADNIEATDESVREIADAVTLINNIAEETALLSLNASIEAARAGEAGRGFAVVATEISKLADESSQSATRIAEIIRKLSEDSHNSITVMNEVKLILDDQMEKLNATKKGFGNVTTGIISSRSETGEINTQAKECDTKRGTVVDVISSLSAISEENAASSQQTTASMQELNATINLLAEDAKNLKSLAASMDNETKFFKL